MNNKLFFGGVIYIDLRDYTNIVEEKSADYIDYIADFIYDYQNEITLLAKKLFSKKSIATIEYMGDGILIIVTDDIFSINQNDYLSERNFVIKVYENANNIKEHMLSFIAKKKNNNPEIVFLRKLDFGMGIACGNIFEKVSSDGRKLFFGISLNRAAKIGDSMKKTRNNLGISLDMFQRFGYDYFPLNSFEEKRTSLERESYVWIK